ncbi:MAG: TonB-dependent receptor [Pseudomonadota bacterium]
MARRTFTRSAGAGASLSTAVVAAGGVLLVAPGANAEIEEVTVTAERREESVQDVPVAVTAFSAEAVERLQIDDFEDLSLQIPNFSVNTFSKTRINPALRGGSSSLVSAGAEQAVGLFIDDVYYGGPADFAIELFDVERIEVLRGPQGTLFGRNTTGGLINVVTQDPGDSLEGRVQAQLGNYGLNQLGAYISFPIADELAGSIAFQSRQRDGTSFNSVTGNDVDNINRSAVRAKLLWTPADDLEFEFALSRSRADETGIARDAVSAEAFVDLDVLADQNFLIDDDPRTVQQFSDGRYVSEQWVGSLHVTKDFDSVTFQSITSFRSFDAEQEPISLGGVPTPIFAIADGRDNEVLTQEFRVLSNSGGRFNWQAGTFLLRADETRFLDVITRWDESVAGGAFSAIFGCPDQTLEDFESFIVTPSCITDFPELFDENPFSIRENVVTTSYSFYAEGGYQLSDKVHLTAGARYTRDNKELNGETMGEFDWFWNPTPGRVVTDAEDTWDAVTWRAVLDVTPTDDLLFYASAATGFRSGAFDMAQSDPALIDLAVAPEDVLSYEIGAKTRLFGNRVQLNVALFDATYENLQFFVNAVGAGGVATTTNAGEANVQGVEADLIWAMTDELTATVGFSAQDGTSKDILPEAEIPEGTPPQGTIPLSYTIALDYRRETPRGAFYVHADLLHRDEYSLEFIDNSIPQFRADVDGRLNANIGYQSAKGWGVELWATNITNENIVIYGQDFWFSLYGASLNDNPELFNASFGPRYAEPRLWGLSASYSFGGR